MVVKIFLFFTFFFILYMQIYFTLLIPEYPFFWLYHVYWFLTVSLLIFIYSFIHSFVHSLIYNSMDSWVFICFVFVLHYYLFCFHCSSFGQKELFQVSLRVIWHTPSVCVWKIEGGRAREQERDRRLFFYFLAL